MRKPDTDIIAIWKGFGYPHRRVNLGLWDSKARVRIWQGNNCEPTFIVLSDLDEPDTGTSITNSSENVATLIKRKFIIEESAIWFEHYPRHNTSQKILRADNMKEEVSQVTYSWHPIEQRFYKPKWVYITQEQAELIINGSLGMDDYRLINEVQLQ